jgi:glucosylceramidase
VKYNPEFYLMKHLGHFVQTGAYRLETPLDKNMLAFVNPDGTVSVIVANVTDTEETMSIELGGQKVTLTLPPHSFNTVSWKK